MRGAASLFAALAAMALAAAAVLRPVAAAPTKKGKVVGGPKDVVRIEDVKYIACQESWCRRRALRARSLLHAHLHREASASPPHRSELPRPFSQVCQLLAKNAWLQVKQMKKASTPANPVRLQKWPRSRPCAKMPTVVSQCAQAK